MVNREELFPLYFLIKFKGVYMKSIDDYKITLHNSAIVINDCDMTDFPTLMRSFSIYDPLYHRIDHLGIYYDKNNRKLYLPRGIDVDYVKRKVQSNIEDDLTSTVVHNHSYGKIKPIKMKMLPRDDVQKEALKFVLCKDKYSYNSSKSQYSLNLNTGKGKTYIASCVLSYLGIRAMVITAQSGILDQWKERVKEYTTIEDSEIVKIEGGPMIARILNGTTNISGKSLYLCTHSTLHSYGTSYGWDKIYDLFKILGIGIKFFDEAHQNFQNMALIDFAARDVWRTYYITATPSRSDRQEDQIYKLYMKNIPSIDLFNPEVDPHTNYIAIKYNSYPKPSDVNSVKNSIYGLSNPLYIDYLMRNERFWLMFDYIFSIIYKNGGKALFYIGTNSGIAKIKQRILFNYPELRDDVGIYSSISENKQLEKNKKYILTTTKSAGAGEDIHSLKYSVVLAEPFKSEVLARQTLGRTRDPNTIYIELVDVGFKQIIAYFNAKRPIFNKYALSTKVMVVDNPKMINLEEETRIYIRDRFKYPIENNIPKMIDAVTFIDSKITPAIYFSSNSLNKDLQE